jgi:hypothetical protein
MERAKAKAPTPMEAIPQNLNHLRVPNAIVPREEGILSRDTNSAVGQPPLYAVRKLLMPTDINMTAQKRLNGNLPSIVSLLARLDDSQ